MSIYSKISVVLAILVVAVTGLILYFSLFPKSPRYFSSDVTLVKGEEVIVPGSSVKIKLEQNTVPNEDCYDCMSKTTLTVKVDNIVKTIEYICGGFAGECVTSQVVNGVRVDLINASEQDKVRVSVKKD